MAWRLLMHEGSHVSKQLATSNALAGLGSHLKLSLYQLRLQAISIENEGRRLLGCQRRQMSSYTSNYARRLEHAEGGSKLGSEDKQVSLLKQLNKVDPESVIQWFESRPSSHHSSAAMAEYVKALVKVDRLDESALLRTLQQGAAIAGNGMRSETSMNVASTAAPVLGSAGVMTKEGLLGTPQAPIHMVTAEGGLKVQAWRTLRTDRKSVV